MVVKQMLKNYKHKMLIQNFYNYDYKLLENKSHQLKNVKLYIILLSKYKYLFINIITQN